MGNKCLLGTQLWFDVRSEDNSKTVFFLLINLEYLGPKKIFRLIPKERCSPQMDSLSSNIQMGP